MFVSGRMYDEGAEGGTTGSNDWLSGASDTTGEAAPKPPVSLAQRLRESGYPIDDGVDDLELVEQLSEAYASLQSAPSADELEQYRQAQPVLADYARNAAEFYEWQKQSKAALEQSTKKDDEQATGWKPLQEDPTWDALTKWDPERNEWVPRSPYGAQAAADRNRYHQEYQARARRMLAGNPLEVIREAGLDDYIKQTRDELRKELLDELRQQQYESVTEDRLRGDLEQYKSVLFQLDKDGGVLRQNGQPVRTEIGEAYYRAARMAQEKWQMKDRALIHEFAMDRITPLIQAASQPPDDDEAEAEAKIAEPTKKEKFLDRAKAKGRRPARDPEQGASVAVAAARSDGRPVPQTWEQIMKETKAELV